MSKTESPATKRRQRLRQDLIAAAEKIIQTDGSGALNARALANDVGCSVGTIYNVYEDLDDLKIAVNSHTLARLDRSIVRTTNLDDETSNVSVDTLVDLGRAYARFAARHPRLWMALFEEGTRIGRQVPDWHMDEHSRLMARIERALAALRPGDSQERNATTARLLFSAVHGLVLLGLQDLYVAVPAKEIEKQIEFLVRTFMAGLDA